MAARNASGFASAAAVAVTVLVAVALAMTLSPVLHRSLFEVVPPDGLVSLEQRVQLDDAITAYLTDGRLSHLTPLSNPEQQHLAEVRSLVLWALGLLLVFTGLSWRLGVDARSLELALVLTVVFATLLTVSFQSLFYGFHELLFRRAPWIFDPTAFVITQLYPLEFFQLAWLATVGGTIGAFGLWRSALHHQRRMRGSHGSR